MAPKRFEPPVYVPRKAPGRPKRLVSMTPLTAVMEAEAGDNRGTTATNDRINSSVNGRAQVQQTNAPTPRLVDLAGAAGYLSVSTWTIREWAAKGWLSRVRFLMPDGHEVRKLLFDKRDLDALIERSKECP
jgi:hypothetical protein